MAERALNRRQRRALERQIKKSPLIQEERTKLDPIKRQMVVLSDRNRDKSISEVSEEDRIQAAILAAQFYRVFRPSRFSVAELSSAVYFTQKPASTEGINAIDQGLAEEKHVGGIFDPITGRVRIFLGAEVLQSEFYRRGPAYLRAAFTPISVLMQVLTHDYHHKAAQSLIDTETGFSVYPHFNEIATEDLNVRIWKQAGYLSFSGYPLVTDRMKLLDFALQRANISEQEFVQLYFSQKTIGLVSRLVSPRMVNIDADNSSDQDIAIVRRGVSVIKAIEQGDQQFLSRFFSQTPRR